MPHVGFDLPAEMFAALRKAPDEFTRDMRIAAAIRWYQKGEISQGRAAEIAGVHRPDFLRILAEEKSDVFVVDLSDLEQELNRE